MLHNTAHSSITNFRDPIFEKEMITIRRRLEIVAHMYKDEKFTCRELISRANEHGGKEINYTSGQPRVSELIKSNFIHKTREYKKEEGKEVELYQYGSANLVVVKTYHEIFVEEVTKRVDGDTLHIIKAEADRLFKYNRNRS